MLEVALLLPAQVNQPRKEYVDHVVDLVDLDLEVEQRSLEEVKLVGRILRVHLPVPRLALLVTLLEVLVFLLLQQSRPRALFLELADNKLRGQLLYLLDHVQLLHQDVTVALICGHFKLLQQSKSDKSVEADSSHQYQENHNSRHTIGHYVLAESNSRQCYYHDFKAIVERSVHRGKEETMREEHNHYDVDPDNLHDVHVVEHHLPRELEGHFRFDAVEIDDPCSARRVVQRRTDVKSQWKEESAQECEVQEQRIIAPPRIGTDQQQHYLEHSAQNHVLMPHHPALAVLVVKPSRDEHANQQQHGDSRVEQSQTADDQLLSDIVHLINGQSNREERGIGDDLLEQQKFDGGDAHKQRIQHGHLSHLHLLVILMVILGLYLLQFEEVLIDGQFSLELDGHDERIVLELVLDRAGHRVAHSRGLSCGMLRGRQHELSALPIISILINLNIINKSKGWPLSSSAWACAAAETTSFPS